MSQRLLVRILLLIHAGYIAVNLLLKLTVFETIHNDFKKDVMDWLLIFASKAETNLSILVPDPDFVKSVVHHEPVDAEHLRWTFEKFEKEKKLKQKLATKISFLRFVKFVLFEAEHKKVSHGTYHWLPFSDFCGLCHVPFDYIGKLETLKDDLNVLINKFPEEVRPRIAEIFSKKKNASVGKSSTTSAKYFRQLPKTIISKLYRAFENDCLLAGYPYPANYLDLGY